MDRIHSPQSLCDEPGDLVFGGFECDKHYFWSRPFKTVKKCKHVYEI